MNKFFKIILLVFIFILLSAGLIFAGIFWVFSSGKAPGQENGITWGVDFSQSQAEYLKLNWKETYLALIDDLGARNIKLHTNWSWVEGKRNEFFYKDIDWQIKQAEDNNVKIIYVLGLKTGRWPECHAPSWAKNLPENEQKTEILKYITEIVQRYKGSKAIAFWQVENEPLFRFGICPSWYYKNDKFLKTEVALVKSLDPSRKIIISDSGEQSAWFNVAKIGDIVGITLYRSAWTPITDTFGFNSSYSFLNPTVYYKKAKLVNDMFKKKVIGIELQAEPWASKPFLEAPFEEQLKSMNKDMFLENVSFAKATGFDTFYFWGAEWWYWMKEKQNKPEIWLEAKTLFSR